MKTETAESFVEVASVQTKSAQEKFFRADYRVTINATTPTMRAAGGIEMEEEVVREACGPVVKAVQNFFGAQFGADVFCEVEVVTPSQEQKPIKGARPLTIEMWARIKKSSKYYEQGLNAQRKPIFFPVESLFANKFEENYVVRFNCNQYRLEDVELWVRTHDKLHRLK